MNPKLIEKQELNDEDFRQLKRVFGEKEKFETNKNKRTKELVELRHKLTTELVNLRDKIAERRHKERKEIINMKYV